MMIATPSGLRIDRAEERLLAFLRAEWPYYDGVADDDPNRVTILDVLAPVMVNAYVGVGADRLQAIHKGMVANCEPLLAAIPTDADLRHADLGRVGELLDAAISIPGVLAPVATKILHRKRRRLIPILDNIVLAHYLRVDGPLNLPARTQDKRRAAGAAMEVLRLFRDDLLACNEDLEALCSIAAQEGLPVTPLRVLEVLAWSELEPRGYYRA